MLQPKTRNVIWIGIDPGASGGIAVISNIAGDLEVRLSNMPKTDLEMWGFFNDFQPSWKSTVVCLERVTGFVGGSKATGAQMFKLGVNYGHLRMCVLGNSLELHEPTAIQWQQALNIHGRETVVTDGVKVKESDTSFKNRLKERAQALYPKSRPTLKTCDALLIAHYCKFHLA